jgi:hypothetical protein
MIQELFMIEILGRGGWKLRTEEVRLMFLWWSTEQGELGWTGSMHDDGV